MTIFITKTWGFSIPCGPLQFRSEGWRARARADLKPGDMVAIIGTKGPQTKQEEQGRILGIMEPSREVTFWQDFDLPTRPEHFNEGGEYRWPFGLLNRNAWVIPEQDRLLLEEISSREFDRTAALGIVPLTEKEASIVAGLQRERVELLMSVRPRARLEGEEVARRRGAPPPNRRPGIMYLRDEPAYTYLMAIEQTKPVSYKIGWAFEYRMRQRQFNQVALPELGGVKYQMRLHRLWDTARQAFRMEQALLWKFDDALHRTNREVVYGITYSALEAAWVDYLQGA
jgi:hypothetical protein